MDKKVNIYELKKLVQDFCEERDWDQFHNPKDLAIGISTEANELLDIFRFKSLEQMKEMMDKPQVKEKIQDELADTFFFILRFAQRNGIDLADALESKIKMNEKKYPKEKALGSNKKYNE